MTAALIAAPLAWPSNKVDCGFVLTKTFSIATQSGLNWLITSSSPIRIILIREAKSVS